MAKNCSFQKKYTILTLFLKLEAFHILMVFITERERALSKSIPKLKSKTKGKLD
jgi:hypothetical protein